jgi:putative peptidoglycan lipid II flippase
MTAVALLYYAIGLWAFSGVRIVVSLYYALQDTRTPVKMAAISVLVNIGAGILLMGPLQHGGLALATSLASMVNLSLLVWALKKKIGLLEWGDFLLPALKTLLCSSVMGIAVYVSMSLILQSQNRDFWTLCWGLILTILIGLLVYAGSSLAMRSPEMADIIHAIRNIAGRKPESGGLG